MRTATVVFVGLAVLAGSAFAGTTVVQPPPKPPPPVSDNLFVVDGKDSASKLTINGEIRTQLEWQRNLRDFDGDRNDENDFGETRIRLGLDFKFSDGVSFFFQPQADYMWGGRSGYNEPGVLGIDAKAGDFDRDSLDVYQAYVTLGGTLGQTEMNLKVGRMELNWGNELVLGDNDSRNGLSFDVVKLEAKPAGVLELSAIAGKVVENDRILANGVYATRHDQIPSVHRGDVNIYGVDGVLRPDETGDVKIEAYLLAVDSENTRDPNGAIRSFYAPMLIGRVWTLGTYIKVDELSTKLEDYAFDLSFDAAAQWGSVEDPRSTTFHARGLRDVFAAEGEVGLTINAAKSLKPRLAIGAAIASGDRESDDDTLNTFQTLFQDTGARLGAANIFALSNLITEYAKLSVSPDVGSIGKKPKLEIGAAYYKFEAYRDRDTVGALLPPGPDGKEVSDEIDVYTKYLISKNTSVKLTYAWVDPCDFIREQPTMADSTAGRLLLELTVSW